MMDTTDAVTVLLLAYWRTGSTMVAFDSQASPIDRPAYVRKGGISKLVAGATWPIAAKLNNELGWHLIILLSSVGVAGLAYWAVGRVVETEFLRAFLAWVVCLSPIGSALSALVSTILWPIVSRALGWRMPDAVARRYNE